MSNILFFRFQFRNMCFLVNICMNSIVFAVINILGLYVLEYLYHWNGGTEPVAAVLEGAGCFNGVFQLICIVSFSFPLLPLYCNQFSLEKFADHYSFTSIAALLFFALWVDPKSSCIIKSASS